MAYIILTGIAVLMGFCWFVSSPGYEPALTTIVTLAALIGAIVKEKHFGTKSVDKDLFLKLTNQLPSNGSIQFISEYDMAEPSFEMAKLSDLTTFLYEWDNVEHEFLNQKLERQKKQLHKLIEEYLIAIGGNTYPTNKTGWNSVPVEWRLEQPKKYLETVKMLNELARKVVEAHKIFFRATRAKLKC